MSKLSIIIPVYYNEDTLMDLYLDMKEKIFPSIPDYEIVMVDDGSGDNSWGIMNEIRDEHVKLVKLSRNFGEHAALLAGFSVCTGDCAVTKQADLQEDSTLILEMFESWKKGNKVVLAIRRSRDENFIKVFFANRYYAMVRRFVNKEMPSGGCDCYLIDRRVIEVIERLDEKNSSLTLQVMWSGFKTDKVYFDRKDREKGKSRWTLSKKLRLVMDTMISFSNAPIKFMIVVGTIFDIFALGLFISVLVEYFTKGVPMMIGILGEYLWRVLDAARNRPVFIIDEVYKERAGEEKTLRDKQEEE